MTKTVEISPATARLANAISIDAATSAAERFREIIAKRIHPDVAVNMICMAHVGAAVSLAKWAYEEGKRPFDRAAMHAMLDHIMDNANVPLAVAREKNAQSLSGEATN